MPNSNLYMNLRNSCHFLEKTSLDSAANDYVNYCRQNELSLLRPEAMRGLARNVVRSGLSQLVPSIRKITLGEVMDDIADDAVINLGANENLMVSITLGDGIDIIKRALKIRNQMINQKEVGGADQKIPFPISDDDVVTPTAEKLTAAWKALERQGDAYNIPRENDRPAVTLANQKIRHDLMQIDKITSLLEDTKRELCGHSNDYKLRTLGQLIDVITHEFEATVEKSLKSLKSHHRAR